MRRNAKYNGSRIYKIADTSNETAMARLASGDNVASKRCLAPLLCGTGKTQRTRWSQQTKIRF